MRASLPALSATAGVYDISYDFYPGGRHEMLNEINRGEVRTRLLPLDLFDFGKKERQARIGDLKSTIMKPTDNSVAFGAPGIEPRWTSSAKEGVGTAYHTSCRLWFTLSHGIVNEIYYSRVDQQTHATFSSSYPMVKHFATRKSAT
jgi:Glucodextranase, domain N